MMNRRGFLAGLGAILAAPAIVPRASLMLMPRRPVLVTVNLTIEYTDAVAWLEDQIQEALMKLLRSDQPVRYTEQLPPQMVAAIQDSLRGTIGLPRITVMT